MIDAEDPILSAADPERETERPAYLSAKKGDVIAEGAYQTPDHSLCIAYIDVVVDPELYRVSQGARGWFTFRHKATRMTDADKAEAIASMKAQCAKDQRSAELASELMDEALRAGKPQKN